MARGVRGGARRGRGRRGSRGTRGRPRRAGGRGAGPAAGEPDADADGDAAGEPDGEAAGLPDALGPAAGAAVGPKPAYWPVFGTTNALSSTSPALLSWKTTGCASPFSTASLPPSMTAEALPLPPRTIEPPAGTVTLPAPSAGFSTTLALLPGRVTASMVCALVPLLKNVAETTASPPFLSLAPWVITSAFWTLMSPLVTAAVSGLIWSVCASLPAPQAASEAIENTTAVAARAPRRRLRLTAAATPWTYGTEGWAASGRRGKAALRVCQRA